VRRIYGPRDADRRARGQRSALPHSKGENRKNELWPRSGAFYTDRDAPRKGAVRPDVMLCRLAIVKQAAIGFPRSPSRQSSAMDRPLCWTRFTSTTRTTGQKMPQSWPSDGSNAQTVSSDGRQNATWNTHPPFVLVDGNPRPWRSNQAKSFWEALSNPANG